MKRVLIIEDSAFIRQLLIENLVELQMEIVGEGCTPAEGLALFKTYAPDVTLIDYSLPNQTGFQLAEELLKHDIYARLILMIPHRMFYHSHDLIAMGIRAVITKPFYPEKLQSTLIEVIEDL
ncbi:MAG: response regulator [Candidatus Sericytochromatia bacterium]